MVDCELIDLSSIGPEDRLKIIKYVLDKGINPWDLGFSPQQMADMIGGKLPISNLALCSALRRMDLSELNNVLGSIPKLADEDDLIRVLSRAKVDEGYRKLLLETVCKAFNVCQQAAAPQVEAPLSIKSIRLSLALKLAVLERRIPQRAVRVTLWAIEKVATLFSEFLLAMAIAFIIIHSVPGAGRMTDPVGDFLSFISMVLKGHLGWSRTFGAPVSTMLALTAPWTIIIVSIALTLSFFTGYMLGLVSAARPGGFLDSFLNALAAFTQSVPSYVIALTFIIVFGVILKVMPIAGISSMGISPKMGIIYVLDVAHHLILPILTYYIILFPNWVFMTRSLAVSSTNEDYVLAARARGLKERRIMMTYVGRNSMMPLMALLSYSYGILFGNSIFIETMFGIPGLGYLISVTAGTSDYVTTVSAFMVIIISVIIGNFIADMTYSLVDPRIRGSL